MSEAKNKNTLKSIYLDLDKGVYLLNGEDISDNVKMLCLRFDNGIWSLQIEQTVYFCSDPEPKE